MRTLLLSPLPAFVCRTTFCQREYPEAIKNYRMALDQVSISQVVSNKYSEGCRGWNRRVSPSTRELYVEFHVRVGLGWAIAKHRGGHRSHLVARVLYVCSIVITSSWPGPSMIELSYQSCGDPSMSLSSTSFRCPTPERRYASRSFATLVPPLCAWGNSRWGSQLSASKLDFTRWFMEV